MAIWGYFIFFALRGLMTLTCAYFTKKPDGMGHAIRCGWMMLDSVALTAVTIWITTFFFNPENRKCATED